MKPRTYHGMRDSVVYQDWTNIKARCTNPNDPKYSYYGGKGIKISEDFYEFMDFYNYLSTLPDFDLYIKRLLTIDRIKNGNHYEKGNIRFATRQQQCFNQSLRKDNKTGITGIGFRKDRNLPFIARIRQYGKNVQIGSFKTKEEAISAYNNHPSVKNKQSILSLINELK